MYWEDVNLSQQFLVYISIMVTTYHSGHYLHNITIIEQRNQFIKLFGYKACLQRHFQDRKTLSSGKKTCQDESGEIWPRINPSKTKALSWLCVALDIVQFAFTIIMGVVLWPPLLHPPKHEIHYGHFVTSTRQTERSVIYWRSTDRRHCTHL